MDRAGLRGLHDVLTEQAQRHPDKDAYVFQPAAGPPVTITFADCLEAVERCAVALDGVGIGRGDAVILHVGASIEFLTSWFALLRLGAVAVPTNLVSPAPELAHAMEVSDARHVITEPRFATLFDEVGKYGDVKVVGKILARTADHPATEGLQLTRLLAAVPAGARVDRPAPGPDAVAEILFTSGTTSRPKGALLTHANLIRSGERVALHYALTPDDRPMTVLPLFHTGGQCMGVLCSLVVGATCVLIEQYSAGKFWRQARGHGATFVMLVAIHVRTLLAQDPAEDDGAHSLRRTAFGMKVTDEERDAFEQRFGVELSYCYGQTEACLLIAIAPPYGPKRWPSVGLPAFDRVVRTVDEEGRELPVGEVGEILVSADPGRTAMLGYANDPEATAATLRDGWLHTGDFGTFDERGYLHFVDRKKDMIKRAGENVSALEVETVLTAHPKIAEAAVVAVADPVRDEAVKAFVVTTPGGALTEDEVVAHCSEYLARFKVPTEIAFIEALPKTSIGKVAKKELRDR